MDNEQNLANLSVSLSAKDVNVKDMFDSLKKEALNLQKEISGAFDMSEIKNAVSDMRRMTSELKGATTQITALSNSMRQSANDLKSISKETGFKKLKKDIDSANQSTKKFSLDSIKTGLKDIKSSVEQLGISASNNSKKMMNIFPKSQEATKFVSDFRNAKDILSQYGSEIQNISNRIKVLQNGMNVIRNKDMFKGKLDGYTQIAQDYENSVDIYNRAIQKYAKEGKVSFEDLKPDRYMNVGINVDTGELELVPTLVTKVASSIKSSFDTIVGLPQKFSNAIKSMTNEVIAGYNACQTSTTRFASVVRVAGSAFQEGANVLGKMFQRLQSVGVSALNGIRNSLDSIKNRFNELGGAQGILDKLQKGFISARNSATQMSKGLNELSKSFNIFNKNTKKSSTHTYTFSRMMKDFARNLVLYGFAMRGIMSVVNAMGTTMWGALNTNEQFVASLNNIKANLAVAFMPIYNTILPAINALMSALAGITRIIGSLFASLFGSSYDEMLAQANKLFGQIKANEEAEKGGADAVKDKTKEYKKQLLAVDEINNLTLDQDTGASGGGGSGGAETDFEQLEGFGVNVDALKKKLEELFQPIKNSWNKYGKGVIDSVKYSFSEIWELIKSIGRSFEEVWLNGTGEQTFDYIFQILTNIFNIIGDIAKALREAWEENNTGTKIIQALWNSFNNVLEIVERLTRAIQDWSRQADFTNMMNSVLNLSRAFEKLTDGLRETLVPIFDNYITPVLNTFVNDIIPSVINGVAKLVSALGSDFTWLGMAIATLVGSQLTGGLSNFIGLFGGLVGSLSSGIGFLTSTLSILVSKIPFVGTTMSALGSAMMSVSGIVLALGGSFFYLLGSNDELTKWINDVVKSISSFVSKIDFGKMAKDFSDGFKNVLDTVAKGITTFDWGSVAKTVSSALVGIFNFFGNIDFGDLYAGISNVVNSMIMAIGTFLASFDFNALGESIGTMVANLFNVVLQFVLNFDWITFVTSILNVVINALMGLVQLVGSALISFLDGVLGIGKESVEDLWNNYLVPFSDWIASTFTSIWNAISTLFTTVVLPAFESIGNGAKMIWDNVLSPLGNFISTVFTDIWNGFIGFVFDMLNPAIKTIGESFGNIWNNYLKPFIDWISNTFTSLFNGAINGVLGFLNTFKNSTSQIIKGAQNIYNGFLNFLNGSFTGNWKKVWNGVKSIFKGIWDTFYGIAKAPINMVIGAINAMINGIETGINYVISAINRLSFDVPDWVPGIGGDTWGFNIGKVNFGNIPQLAEGGIAYGDTLVNVAEYVGARANPEVIAPLDKLNGMIYDGISELMKNNTNNQFNPNDYDIVTEVELKVGEEQIAKATAKGKAKIEKKTGRPLFNT